MGSGGMIVMDDTSCMVDVARFFMEFCMAESCGKCVPCRVGTVQMHDLLRQHHRRARPTDGDLALLEELCDMVQEHQPVRPGPDGAQPGAEHAALLPRRIHAHIAREALPGRRRARMRPSAGGRGMSPHDAPERAGRDAAASTARTSAPARTRRILEVARENGIDIPTLCHLDGLSRRRRLPPVPGRGQGHRRGCCPACVTQVAEGMEVVTDTRAAAAATAG